MNERSRIQKRKKTRDEKPSGKETHPVNSLQEDLLTGAMDRLKNPDYPVLKTGDAMQIQQGLGNKTLNLMVAQRHLIPKNREGVGEEEDVIQKMPFDGSLQRHNIPGSREGTGEENEEIGAIQRSPYFGRRHQAGTSNSSRILWGNGSRADVQRKNGKTEAAPKKEIKTIDVKGGGGAEKKAPVIDDEATIAKAEEEYSKFVAGGPYRIPNFVPDTVDPMQYGKFDAIYDPARHTVTADMRVKFTFPDLNVPDLSLIFSKGPVVFPQATALWLAKKGYVNTWLSQVHSAWSGKFTFMSVREPQKIWKRLNPINVKVNVSEIKEGAANQHYTIKAYLKKLGVANVTGNKIDPKNPNPSQLELFKDDMVASKQDFTGDPSIGADELSRLQRNLPKIHFANNSMKIEGKYLGDMQYVADYLRQMNRPKFIIEVIGHANKTGKEDTNIKFSTARAQIVHDRLKSMGVSNHTIKFAGVGSLGANEYGYWRKVDFKVSVDKSFSNIQNTTAHEFGHMLGLDDEYVRKGDTRKFTTQKTFMEKMLGSESYGKGAEGKLAEERTAVLNLASASVMERGNEIRPYHYVTLWQALYEAAAKAPSQPVPPFTWKDWKLGS